MPKNQQRISLNGIDNETALAYSYQAMQDLDWNVVYAGENNVCGSTPGKWKTKGQQIICAVSEGQLTITSEMVNQEMMDILGTNKKNTNKLVAAFEAAKNSATIEKTTNNIASVNAIKAKTINLAEEETREQLEMDKALNLSGSNLYVTYTIIGINVLVFILMAANGAGIVDANSLVHISWGSNYSPLTLTGDYWRLLTSTFIHFGIIHLLMNMYCLYTVGIYLEPMLGKIRYTAAYICTGILASLTSLWWHTEPLNSAGASGAVFGLYGLFIALLTSNLVPKKMRQQLLQSTGIFIVYNLAYGMKGGVDNAAHIGGLVSGFVVGLAYVFGLRKEKQEQKLQWLVPGLVVLTLVISYAYLDKNKGVDVERVKTLKEIKEASYADNDKFNADLSRFDNIHKTINEFVNDSTLTDDDLVKKIDDIGLPQWEEANQLISNTTKYNISPDSHAKAAKVILYISLRKNELILLKQMAQTKNTEGLIPQLNDVRTRAYATFDEVVAQ
ncbi:MAG: rhomboid family intramembrane serine protease [Ferruginibacter sp.]